MGSAWHRWHAPLGALTAIFALGCGFAGADQSSVQPEATVASSEATRVEVIALESATMRLELDLPGEVEGSRDALLAAANGGYVERVYVRAGDVVETGARIASVDVALFAAQSDQAAAQADQAEAELERVRRLGDLASAQQVLLAETNARVSAASARQARTRLSRAMVSAPFDGVVASVGVEVGESTGPGAPVARLVQLDPVLVTLSVSDRDVGALRVGDPVDVWAAAAGEGRRGTIRHIAPAADLNTRAFPVEVEVENAERELLPGMIARVTVSRSVGDGVVIPQDWLVTRRRDRGVFVEQDGLARWRPITLGDVVHDEVIVTDGLAPGDRVVVTGHRELMDGDSLIISREGTCCSAGRPVFE